MKKTLAIALLALSVAGAASAASQGHINAAQEKLDRYGFSVDASSLSNAQISMLVFVDESSDDDVERVNTARATTAIQAILN